MTQPCPATIDPPVEGTDDLDRVIALDDGEPMAYDVGDDDEPNTEGIADDNCKRAAFAATALKAYSGRAYQSAEDLRSAVTDLFGDLMHLCDLANLDIDEMVKVGRRNHDDELVGNIY